MEKAHRDGIISSSFTNPGVEIHVRKYDLGNSWSVRLGTGRGFLRPPSKAHQLEIKWQWKKSHRKANDDRQQQETKTIVVGRVVKRQNNAQRPVQAGGWVFVKKLSKSKRYVRKR